MSISVPEDDLEARYGIDVLPGQALKEVQTA